MIVDYHVHTPYCGHAHGQIIQYVQTAIQKGFTEIAFTDHLGRYYLSRLQKRRYWDWGMNERDLARYYSELCDLKEVFEKQIKIKIGLEIDYIEGAEELLLPILDQFPLDFRIGSVHCLPHFGWKHLSEYTKQIPKDFSKEYFRMVKAALKSKLFQSIAHVDFIWRCIELTETDLDSTYNEITDIAKAATEQDICLEVNANGYLWSQSNEILPHNPFTYLIEQIKLCDTKITIGSDAHEPFLVGKSFPSLIPFLHEKGINQTCCFTDGKRTSCPLG